MSVTIYNHTQTTPNTTWTITHSLNTIAINIDVMIQHDGITEKVFPGNIIIQDINTVIVTFSSAFAGNARLIGH